MTLAVAMAFVLLPIKAKAAPTPTLPFALKAPTHTSLSWMEGADSITSMSYSFSKDSELTAFLAQKGSVDETEHEKAMAKIKACGYDDLYVGYQVDWAIDDKQTGWHYTSYWDTMGHKTDEGGNLIGESRAGYWDIVDDFGVTEEASQTIWIMRGCPGNFEKMYDDEEGTIENPGYYEWNGSADGSPQGYHLGLRTQLSEGQYIIEHDDEGQAYIRIDYNTHTVYVRSRFVVLARPESGPNEYYFSDWSEVAGYGKLAPAWKPYTKATLPAPAVSALHLTGEKFNGEPVAAYTLSVQDSLAKGITEVEARGGSLTIETEMRAKGTDTWTKMQGDWIVKGGEMEVKLITLAGNGRMIPDGSELEFRARFHCDQYTSYGGTFLGEFYTDYSPILTVKTTQIGSGKSIYDTSTGTGEQSGSSMYAPIHSLDAGALVGQVDTYVKALKDDKDPKGTIFGYLYAKQKKNTKNSIALTWKKPANAAYYVIYGTKCGKASARYLHMRKTEYIKRFL